MKKKVMAALLAVLMLSGCGAGEDPYRVDTVVRIPVNPTDAPTEPPETEGPSMETEVPTEEPAEETTETAAATETATTQSSGSSKSSGKKNSSGKSSGSSKNNTKETQPKETESAATEPPATEPEATASPTTEPTVTEPPSTESEETEASITEPAAGETEPTATEPTATEAPETEPEETEAAVYDISGYSLGSLEYAMEVEINAARDGGGLSGLGLNSRLSAIASCRAYEISLVWSHTRPDGRGYATVLGDYGYGAASAAELLVYVTGDGDAVSIVAKWLQSDSHRENLMGSWTSMGIGIYRANGYTYVCCLLTA